MKAWSAPRGLPKPVMPARLGRVMRMALVGLLWGTRSKQVGRVQGVLR